MIELGGKLAKCIRPGSSGNVSKMSTQGDGTSCSGLFEPVLTGRRSNLFTGLSEVFIMQMTMNVNRAYLQNMVGGHKYPRKRCPPTGPNNRHQARGESHYFPSDDALLAWPKAK